MFKQTGFAQSVENVQVEFLLGDFSKCWKTWAYHNIVPNYSKFYYVMDGEFYVNIDKSEYIAKKGDLFFIPASSVQSYYHISEHTAVKYWFHFIVTCNNNDLSHLINLPHMIHVPEKDHDMICKLFKNILFEYGSGSVPSILSQKANVLQLLAYFIDNADIDSQKVIKEQKMSVLLSYIEDHLQEEITIENLCNKVHLHPNYFIKFFRQKVGLPPIEYINNLRIARAKVLLYSQDMSVQDVAYSVGFKGPYYFSRIFKAKTGFSPTEYRRMSSSRQKEAE